MAWHGLADFSLFYNVVTLKMSCLFSCSHISSSILVMSENRMAWVGALIDKSQYISDVVLARNLDSQL